MCSVDDTNSIYCQSEIVRMATSFNLGIVSLFDVVTSVGSVSSFFDTV